MYKQILVYGLKWCFDLYGGHVILGGASKNTSVTSSVLSTHGLSGLWFLTAGDSSLIAQSQDGTWATDILCYLY